MKKWTKRELAAVASARAAFRILASTSGYPDSAIDEVLAKNLKKCILLVCEHYTKAHKSPKERAWYGKLHDRIEADGLPEIDMSSDQKS